MANIYYGCKQVFPSSTDALKHAKICDKRHMYFRTAAESLSASEAEFSDAYESQKRKRAAEERPKEFEPS